MVNSRDSKNDMLSNNYNIPYCVGTYLENKENSGEIIKVFGYFIDKSGVVVYINHNIYNSNIDDCEIIKLEQLNANWIKTSKIITTNIANDSKINIGLSKMIDEIYGHYEVTNKGVILVKRKENN